MTERDSHPSAPGAREAILARLRAMSIASPPLPQIPDFSALSETAPGLVQRFCEMLKAVGGTPIIVTEGLLKALDQTEQYRQATVAASLVPGVGRNDIDLSNASRSQIERLDWLLLPSRLGVAENGAIWLDGADIQDRSAWFLCQHLGIVLEAAAIVPTLHQAYAEISLQGPGYGAFVSGPSKTADIEQSLVIGAHGPRSMTIFIIGS